MCATLAIEDGRSRCKGKAMRMLPGRLSRRDACEREDSKLNGSTAIHNKNRNLGRNSLVA
jgi:hypothetical protein